MPGRKISRALEGALDGSLKKTSSLVDVLRSKAYVERPSYCALQRSESYEDYQHLAGEEGKGPATFTVRYIGNAKASGWKGKEVAQQAAETIILDCTRAGRLEVTDAKKVELRISLDGIHIVDSYTGCLMLRTPIHRISQYCIVSSTKNSKADTLVTFILHDKFVHGNPVQPYCYVFATKDPQRLAHLADHVFGLSFMKQKAGKKPEELMQFAKNLPWREQNAQGRVAAEGHSSSSPILLPSPAAAGRRSTRIAPNQTSPNNGLESPAASRNLATLGPQPGYETRSRKRTSVDMGTSTQDEAAAPATRKRTSISSQLVDLSLGYNTSASTSFPAKSVNNLPLAFPDGSSSATITFVSRSGRRVSLTARAPQDPLSGSSDPNDPFASFARTRGSVNVL